ncbi:MAG: HAMP domain-containing histidine kinase [Clostridiaceae bacterium]|nr:HAMP domain-containing histidine kinase [Clostridiaceae bacterium]
MFGKKISLRLHIFAAFFLVFLITFSTVSIAFRMVIQSYIQSDSKEKLLTTSAHTLQLANNMSILALFKTPAEKKATVIELIQSVSGSSDVKIAMLDEYLYVNYPKSTDSFPERVRVNSIKSVLEKQKVDLNIRSEHVLEIKSSVLYILLVPFNRMTFLEDDRSPDSYLLFYLDSSPYTRFAQSLDQTLYIILLSALFLSIITSMLVSNNIIRSLHKLTTFASRIGAGDFKPLECKFTDIELDSLASDMNLMAYRLSKADTDQKTFFQNASHELRTPLMSIQGYAEGIKYGVFENPDEATDIIISESKRLSDMVENLLTLSRLDLSSSGSHSGKKSLIDLRETLDSVIENIRGSVILAKKNLNFSFPEGAVTVLGNESDLFRAIENLLSNAIRHAQSRIDIELKTDDMFATITVTDDGDGIPEDLLPILFNRFVRGEKGKHGIGLALVKAVAEDHKGCIFASNRSEGQKGAEFTLKIPLSRI